MGRPFGAGRVAEGTGVIPAIPSDAAVDDDALSPMLAMNPNSNVLFFLGAGSGPGAATAIVEVAARVLAAEQPLGDAMAAARVEHRGVPDATFVEPAAVDAVRTGLEGRGHRVERLPAPSVLNAVSCPEGLPRSPDSCVLAADKRGFGLDAVVRR
jgi:gamma-glutamyltranspeptidase/glutathione hydrolase